MSKYSKELWGELFSKYLNDEILDLAKNYPDKKYLVVPYEILERVWIRRGDMDALKELKENPDFVLRDAHDALHGYILPIDIPDEWETSGVEISSFRPQILIRDIRHQHIESFISVTGTILRKTDVKFQIIMGVFECQRCGHHTSVQQPDDVFIEPFECESEDCGRKGPFKLRKDLSTWADKRKIRLQETFENISDGEQSLTVLDCVMIGDVSCPPLGSTITATGILRGVQSTYNNSKTPTFNPILEINHIEFDEKEKSIEITDKDKEEMKRLAAGGNILDRLVASTVPSITGYEKVKEACLCSLVSPGNFCLPDGRELRGFSHVMLVGDPSTGKSMIMKGIQQIVPRAQYAAGRGASVEYNEQTLIRENNRIRLISIGELIDGFYEENRDGLQQPEKKIETLSLNLSTFRFEWKEIQCFYRHRINSSTSLLKFELESGREITVTDDHSIFILKDGKLACKRAGLLNAGDTVVVPGKIPVDDQNDIGEETARFLGYFIAEGHVQNKAGMSYTVEFTLGKHETEIIEDLQRISKRLFGKSPHIYPHGKNGVRLAIIGKDVLLKTKELLGDVIGKKAKQKEVPEIILNSSEKCRAAFLDAYIKGDAGVTKSRKLMSGVLYLLLMNGALGGVNNREDTSSCVIGNRIILREGKRYDLKSPRPKRPFYNIYKNIPIDACSAPIRKYLLKKASSSGYARANQKRLSNKTLLERLRYVGDNLIRIKDMREKYGLARNTISTYMKTKKELFKSVRTGNKWFIALTEDGKNLLSELEHFDKMCEGDMGYVKIKSVSNVRSSSNYVYDFSVEGENFVSGFGGVLCHNSGKGLTVSVIKDKWSEGSWTAEAGMLVLADGALALIDEMDKWEPEQQQELNSALAHGRIPIHKAGINREFNTRCPVIAGLNPKWGRFDRYEPIVKQINVPPDTLSRFDLVFTIFDEPKESDRGIAQHILDIWVKITKKILGKDKIVNPDIDLETMRKWIAYAKTIEVSITPECAKIIENFFMNLRLQYDTDPGASVPIVFRTLDGMMRLLISQARLRLSNVTEERDAQRVMELVMESFKIITDPTTGKLDSDIISTGISKSMRDRIKILAEIIRELQDEAKGAVPLEDIVAKGEEVGLKKDAIEDMLQKLKTMGEVIEASTERFRIV